MISMKELNQSMERRWRAGEITDSQFLWHLMWMNGV